MKSVALFLICLGLNAAGAEEPAIPTSVVAKVFKYPVDKLKIRDRSSEQREKSGNSVMSVFTYESEDASFSPLHLVVAVGGRLLNAKLEERLKNAGDAITKVALPDGSRAYTGTAAVGPGGECHIGIAYLSKLNIDIQLKIDIPSSVQVGDTDETGEYFRNLENPKNIQAILMALLSASSENLSGMPLVSAGEKEELKPVPPPASPQSEHKENKQMKIEPSAANRSQIIPDDRLKLNWLIAGSCVLIIVVVSSRKLLKK